MNLTPCQARALHAMNGNENIFLTGAAGTGKSFLLDVFLRNKSQTAYPVLASTGAAAVLIGGRTFHSFFGLGILEGGREATVQRAIRKDAVQKRISRAECVVIDEVSMLSGEVLATAEEIARRIRGVQEPWGGLRVLAVGDFAQLPPVQAGSAAKDWAFLHPVWAQSQFQPVHLDTMVRTKEQRLVQVLRDIREGSLTPYATAFLQERNQTPADNFAGTRLFPRRRQADAYNAACLARVPETLLEFETEYHGKPGAIEQLKKQCPVPPVLQLKRGALVMLRKNDMAYPYRYVNGTLAHVLDVDEEGGLHLRLLDGDTVLVPRHEFALQDGNGRTLAVAYNYPVTLAWATTIHKSQGASIDALQISIHQLWESGQAYVALSRARSEHGLYIEQWDARSIFVDDVVTNFYRNIRQQWQELSASLPDAPPPIPSASKRPSPKKSDKMPNHHQTMVLLQEEYSVPEISDKLGWRPDTIVRHIERLLQEDMSPAIEHLRPEAEIMNPIIEAFEQANGPALKPVHEKFKGKFSYSEIRLVRLFANLDEM